MTASAHGGADDQGRDDPDGATDPEGREHPVVRSQRLLRSARIRRRREFQRVQSKGKRVHTRHFVMLVGPSPEPAGRVGITVTKKVGNAVARNRVKRRVREVFRRFRALFPPGIDVVFIAKQGAPNVSFAGVVEEVERARHALRKAAREIHKRVAK